MQRFVLCLRIVLVFVAMQVLLAESVALAADDASLAKEVIYLPSNNSKNLTVINSQYAQKLFTLISQDKRIPFQFPERGCEARAHAMSLILEAKGVQSAKIFLTGYFKVNTQSTPMGFVLWQYHVATLVLVKDSIDGSIRKMVFDPALFSQPVSVNKWITEQMTYSTNRLDNIVQTTSDIYSLKLSGADQGKIIGVNYVDIDVMNDSLNTYLLAQEARN